MTAAEVLQPFQEIASINDTDRVLMEAVTSIMTPDVSSAQEYSELATYAVGNYVLYNDAPYQCIEAVVEPGAWDASKWEAVNVTTATMVQPVWILARNFRAYLSQALSVSIGEDGTWFIGGVSTGVSAACDAPQLRATNGFLQYSIDNGTSWTTLFNMTSFVNNILTNGGYVSYNTQVLTASQKAQARTNLGIPDMAVTPVVEKSALSVEINPDVLNRWATPISTLEVADFIGAVADRTNEYMLEFTVDGDNFTLTLPEGVRWMEEPEWEDGYTYQVSIVNNLAIYAGWEAEEEEETTISNNTNTTQQ